MSTIAETNAEPPVAKRLEHRETRHGATVIDPFHWLREKSNPEVIHYLEAENSYTEAMTKHIKGFEAELYNEMLGRIKQTDLSVPERRGAYLYYSRTKEGKQYPILCRRKSVDADEQIMLDENELAKGKKFLHLGSTKISDDGRLLAYTLDSTGFRQYTLQVKDLEKGETLGDSAERVTSIEWAADNKTIFYTIEDAVTKRSDHLWRHSLGSSKSDRLYEEKDELYSIHINRTKDRKFLFLNASSTDTTEVSYLAAGDPQSSFRVFLPREKKHKYYLGHREGLFYIRTNRGAKNYQVMTAAVANHAPSDWKPFLPHQTDVLIERLELFKDYAIAIEKADAVDRMRVLDFKTNQWRDISFPEPVYAAFAMANPEYDTHTFRYSYQSMLTPPSVFDYEMTTGKATRLKRQEVMGGYDPSRYVAERLWASARDGVRVPISIVYRKDIQRDGKAPLFLYAYGSYGLGMSASFSIPRLSLLDRGMVYALAHIRGGNEMGETWHDHGMLMKKKNTFTDFIDSAAFLIREKWTNKDRLVIEGGSAGGLLMGAVVNMRPDLFHAVHLAVPFVDVMNTMMDASLPLTVGEYLEWGDPNDKTAFDYMKSYSPYDNLEKRDYPAMLVTTSLNDSQVMYWEPAKYVARLRSLRTDKRPLLMKVNMAAGHGGSSGRYDQLHEKAFEYAWLLDQAGISK